MKTIEQIVVLWIKKRSIVRAFEVEHTTSVYSGLLRMADLLAMQPNLKIKLHIVAPESRRDKVLREFDDLFLCCLKVALLRTHAHIFHTKRSPTSEDKSTLSVFLIKCLMTTRKKPKKVIEVNLLPAQAHHAALAGKSRPR